MDQPLVKIFFQKTYENYRIYLEDLIKEAKIISNVDKRKILKRINFIAEVIKQPAF